FVKNILEGNQITVFNKGNLERDFTYVLDIVDGIYRVINGNGNNNIYEVYNIGNSNPVNLNDFIQTIEEAVKKKAIIKYLPLREGDVKRTYSDVTKLHNDFGYEPKVNIKEGIEKFVQWYLNSPLVTRN
ncbi:MAG: hypothetical protein B6D64_00975, partial [Bacteroidetes bacterium 4484_276]